MSTSSTTKAILLLILCTFFWGSCFPVGKHVLAEVHAFTLVFWRFIIAAAFLGLYIKMVRIPHPRLSPNQWLWIIVVSAIGIGGLNVGLFTGLKYTNPTNGSLIMALNPLVTSLIVCSTRRTLPTFPQLLSLLISLSGVLLVITNGQFSVLSHLQLNHGDKLIFAGMFAWSLYTYFSQGISQWMPVVPYTFIGMICSAVIAGLICLTMPDVRLIDELIRSSLWGFSGVIYIGLFGTVAGYLLWLNGVRDLGPSNAALFFNFVPIFSILTSFMLGQSVSLLQLSGIAIVIVGLLLPRIMSPKRVLQPAN